MSIGLTVIFRYESEYTDVVPNRKSGGQLGEPQTSIDSNPVADAEQKQARGEKTAENIRYGQTISEEGMGGQTTTSTGQASQEGYGRAAGSTEDNIDATQERREQGYGGEKDMNREIGA